MFHISQYEYVYENEEREKSLESVFANNKQIGLVVENKTNKDELDIINKHISWFN